VSPELIRGLGVRTRYIDDFALQENKKIPNLQFIVLGAGFDTRPFRLPLHNSAHWYEVDTPDVFTLKTSLLANLFKDI